MKAVGEQFVFEVNLRGVRVGEGVDGHVQVKGNFGDGARNREEPFQHAGVLGGTGRAKPLRLRMPVTGQVVVPGVKDLVEHVVHGLHQIVPCSVIGSQINVTFSTAQQAMTNDGRLTRLVLLVKANKGVGGRHLAAVFVGKRPGFTSTTHGAGVAATAGLTKVVKASLALLIDVELTDGFHRSSHHGDLGLSETVDTLFHITNDAHGGIPRTQRTCRVVGMTAPAAPQSGKQTIVGGIGVLVFVNDEGAILTAQFAQNGHAALKVLQQCWSVVEQRERAGDVCVGPRLIAKPVQGIDDCRRVAMPADVGAPGQQ